MPARTDSDDHAALLAAARARDPAAAAEAVGSEIQRAADYVLSRLRFPGDPAPAETAWAGLKPLTVQP